MAGEGRDEGQGADGAKSTLEHDAEADREYTTEGRTRALDAGSRPGRSEPAQAGDFRRDEAGRRRIESPAPAEGGADADEEASRRQAEAGTDRSRRE